MRHKHKHKKNGHVCFSCAYAYVAVIPSEDNIRKASVFVLLMLRASVAAVISSVMLMFMR